MTENDTDMKTTGEPSGGSEKPSRSALRRQREREQRYQTILESAGGLFARDGYHQTSIEQIADRAEVSVGTVYFYFKNKEDLLIRLIDDIGYQIRARLGSEFRKPGITLNTFKETGRIFFEDICLRHPDRIVIFMRESVGQSGLVEARRKQIFEKLSRDIKTALLRMRDDQGIGYRTGFSADVMAAGILGMFERVAYQYLIWRDRPEELKDVAPDVIEFITGGIRSLFCGESPISGDGVISDPPSCDE